MISPLTRSHVLLSVPCPAFAFLMVRWWGKKRAVALWSGGKWWVSSMMPAGLLQQGHQRKPRQISVSVDSRLTLARRGWTLFLCACCTVHCLPFEAASILHHCTVLFLFPSLPTATVHIQYIDRRAKWVTSRWSQKPVGPQSALLNERSAAVYSELLCS